MAQPKTISVAFRARINPKRVNVIKIFSLFLTPFIYLNPLLTFADTEQFGSLLYQKVGATDEMLGFSVAGAGDVDGDGFADFIVGAPLADPNGQSDGGSVYVYSGATGALLYQKNGTTGDSLGFAVDGAGDVNADGRDDFIVGAPGADPDGIGSAGSAYVFSGADGSLLYQKNGVAVFDELGRTVAGVGDIDGDSWADFIIGVPFADPDGIFAAGSALIFSGSTGNLIFQKNGPTSGDRFGESVAGTGDVDGDGRDDFIVGAPFAGAGYADSGSAFVYSGATGALVYQKKGTFAYGWYGNSVAGGIDVNQDGYKDFIIGAPNAKPDSISGAGSAFIYSGADGTLLYQVNGTTAYANLGYSVAGIGDVNGDSSDDFILGAPGAEPGGVGYAGTAYVYSGSDGNLLFEKDGINTLEALGWSVSGADDVNGDGLADFIIGARAARYGTLSYPGAALVYAYSTAIPQDITPPFVNVLAPNLSEDWIVGYPYTIAWTSTDSIGVASIQILLDRNDDGSFDEEIANLPGNPPGAFTWIATGNVSNQVRIKVAATDYSGNVGSDISNSPIRIVEPRQDIALLYRSNGNAPNERFGYSLAKLGDINGDGKLDFLAGAPGTSQGGSVFSYSGITGSLHYRIDALSRGSFGSSAAGGEDVNADGFPDFIVGAPGSAAVYIFSGATGSLFTENRYYYESFGTTVDLIQDVNADGKADYLVGSPYKYCQLGYQLYGGGAANLFTSSGTYLFDEPLCWNNFVGSSVAGVADLNGDGIEDIVVGARAADLIYVYSGATRSRLYAKALVNTAIAGLGDIDGDNKAELLIGNGNGAMVLSGATGNLLYQKLGLLQGNLGNSLAEIGDIDRDGISDFAIGAPTADPNNMQDAGAVFLFSGGTGSLLFQINGGAPGDNFGTSLVGFTDPLDGRSIVIVGAPAADPNGQGSAGSVFVYSLPCSQIKGDLDLNGVQNLVDVLLLINKVFTNEQLLASNCAGDVNCDFDLTPADVVIFLRSHFLNIPITCSP